MGKKIERNRSKTLPSSPTHSFSSSSSSSDFEFRISISPRKSSAALCPADELFYKGQILPLHLSPRISMVRTLLASSSTSSSSTTATASRDSSSSTDSTSSSFAADLSLLAAGDPCCESSRPSSVAEEDDPLVKQRPGTTAVPRVGKVGSKYFSLSRIFKKDPTKTNITTPTLVSRTTTTDACPAAANKKMNSSAKEVIRKYLKKVKPLYEKLSQKQQQQVRTSDGVGVGVGGGASSTVVGPARTGSGTVALLSTVVERSDRERRENMSSTSGGISSISTFSGNLKCPRMIRKSYVASCPSSMRSSPSHSGVLTRGGLPVRASGSGSSSSYSSETSTMEELQNAIQGAIAHCKSSMLQQNTSSFPINNISTNNNNNSKMKNKVYG